MKNIKVGLAGAIVALSASGSAVAEQKACSQVSEFKSCWQKKAKENLKKRKHPESIDDAIRACALQYKCSYTITPTEEKEKA